jgi:trans-aconitate methyltransferase
MKEHADRIIGHYEKHAIAWDADRRAAAWNDKPWLERFACLLPTGARVLDLGCGSGSPVAEYLVGCGFHVTGVDSSPTLIDLCRHRLPDQEWHVSDMRLFRVAGSFEGILAWDSFFHLSPEDQRHMFNVFAEHKRSSSILMFNSGPASGVSLGEYRGDPLYHASLDAAEYETLLRGSDFEIVDHVVEDWRTGGGRTVWLARSSDC